MEKDKGRIECDKVSMNGLGKLDSSIAEFVHEGFYLYSLKFLFILNFEEKNVYNLPQMWI